MDFRKYAIVDLHLHLDGALSPEFVADYAKRNNIKLPTYDPQELRSYLEVPKNCASLNEYLMRFDIPNLVLQDEQGLFEAYCDLMKRLSEQGLKYVEVRMAPQLSTSKGLSQEQVVKSLLKARKVSKGKYKIDSNLILCMMRLPDNDEKNKETVLVAKKFLNKGVVLIDLAGAEALFPNEQFEMHFKLCNELGVPFIVHAGEADGPNSVKTAIQYGAVRIGHGVHAPGDQEVIKLLRDKEIPLEVCPTSNLDTKAIAQLKDLPLKLFRDEKIKVTINTDDPTVSNTTLAHEYEILYEMVRSEEPLKQFALNSIDAARLNKKEKDKLRKLIQ